MVPVWIQIVTSVATMIVMVAVAVLVLGAIPAVFVIRRQIQKTGDEVSKSKPVATAYKPIVRDCRPSWASLA